MSVMKAIGYLGLGLSVLGAVLDHGKGSPTGDAEDAVTTLTHMFGDEKPANALVPASPGPPKPNPLATLGD